MVVVDRIISTINRGRNFGLRANFLTTLYVLMGGGGGGGGRRVVPLIFISLFSAFALIKIISNFQVKSLNGKVHRALEVNQGM